MRWVEGQTGPAIQTFTSSRSKSVCRLQPPAHPPPTNIINMRSRLNSPVIMAFRFRAEYMVVAAAATVDSVVHVVASPEFSMAFRRQMVRRLRSYTHSAAPRKA